MHALNVVALSWVRDCSMRRWKMKMEKRDLFRPDGWTDIHGSQRARQTTYCAVAHTSNLFQNQQSITTGHRKNGCNKHESLRKGRKQAAR